MLKKRIEAASVAFRNPEIIEIRDPLTGAMTRKEFLRIAGKILNRAERDNQIVSLAMLDMDGLKLINDTRGHRAGDMAIKEFAQAIFANIRPLDICARWHSDAGDEFILLLLDVNLIASMSIIQRIQEVFPKFSWGMAGSRFDHEYGLESMIELVEERMYRDKKSKK